MGWIKGVNFTPRLKKECECLYLEDWMLVDRIIKTINPKNLSIFSRKDRYFNNIDEWFQNSEFYIIKNNTVHKSTGARTYPTFPLLTETEKQWAKNIYTYNGMIKIHKRNININDNFELFMMDFTEI